MHSFAGKQWRSVPQGRLSTQAPSWHSSSRGQSSFVAQAAHAPAASSQIPAGPQSVSAAHALTSSIVPLARTVSPGAHSSLSAQLEEKLPATAIALGAQYPPAVQTSPAAHSDASAQIEPSRAGLLHSPAALVLVATSGRAQRSPGAQSSVDPQTIGRVAQLPALQN
jgi:hypothetical protein